MDNTVRKISLDNLIAHPDNSNKMSQAALNKLVRNIRRSGRYEPLVVRPHPHRDGFYQIINGHHRAKALAKLDYEHADALVWQVDDEQTDILLCTLNRLSGSDILKKKVELLRRLKSKMPEKPLCALLPQSRMQLEKLTNLKPPAKAAPQPGQQGEPVVFFLKPPQKETLEQAMSAAEEMLEQKPKSRALIRGLCLTSMAGSFLEFAR